MCVQSNDGELQPLLLKITFHLMQFVHHAVIDKFGLGQIELDILALDQSDALDLSRDELLTLARNSFTGSFLNVADKAKHLAAIDAYA